MGQLASRAAVEEDPLSKKRREIKERGVLIPPSFGVVSVSSSRRTGDGDGGNMVSSPRDVEDVPLSSELRNLQGRLSSQLVPSLLSDWSAHDLSNRILNDFMQAGFWLSTSTSSSRRSLPVPEAADGAVEAPSSTSVKAGFQISEGGALGGRPGSGSSSSLSTKGIMSGGLITLRHLSAGDQTWQARMCVGTDLAAAPSATVAYNVLSPLRSPRHQFVLMGHGSANGTGWVGAHGHVASIGTQRIVDNVQVGSWVTGDIAGKVRSRAFLRAPNELPPSARTMGFSRLGSVADDLGAYVSADFLGSTAALEVKCRLPSASGAVTSSIPQIQTRSYFSINLSDDHRSNNSPGPPPPPLMVTLERSGGGDESINSSSKSLGGGDGTILSALSISQVLHVDRYQVNPLEDRAPKIRNAMAWTIRLERVAPSAPRSGRFFSHDEAYGGIATPGASAAAATTTRLSVGGAWQINRAVAVKAVANPDSLTTALILRRWKEPRVTCSLLFRNSTNQDVGLGSVSSSLWQPRFIGIGLQVETGDDLYSRNNHYADQRSAPFGSAGVSSPETKATLPH